jgi:hypothetical protein
VARRGNGKSMLFVKVNERDRLLLMLTGFYQRCKCEHILLLHVDVAQLSIVIVLQIPKIPLSA